MANYYHPPASYWSQVKRLDGAIYAGARSKSGLLGIMSTGDARWRAESLEQAEVASWSGLRVLGAFALHSRLEIIRVRDLDRPDAHGGKVPIRGYSYTPGIVSALGTLNMSDFERTLAAPPHAGTLAYAVQDGTAFSQGSFRPERMDYDVLLNELERGASGEFDIPPAESDEDVS